MNLTSVEKIYIEDKGNNFLTHPQYVIDNGIGYVPISGYNDYFIINEKIYETEPTRTLDFSMPDINDIAYKFIPHIYVSFNYLTISNYITLLKLLEPSEFRLIYFDFENNRTMKGYFYLKPRERATLYSRARNGLASPKGIRDFSIEFVATMNDYEGG